MNQLKAEGYEIEAVQNKGYRLKASPDVVGKMKSKSRFENRGEGHWAGCRLMYFPETGSTNIDAKRRLREGAPEGTLVVTDCQNTGRGRRGEAGPPLRDAISILPSCCALTASRAGLHAHLFVMALAAAEAVEELGINAGIKWPNDIVAHGKRSAAS